MTDEDFRKTRIKGEKAQARAIEWLKGEHPTIRSVEGDVSGYDLIDDNGYKVEVKLDLASINTENIAIEFSSMGKKSGLAITTADDWVHIFNYMGRWVYVVANVLDLKSFIGNNWSYLHKVDGGFNKYSKMVLVPKSLVVENFNYFSV